MRNASPHHLTLSSRRRCAFSISIALPKREGGRAPPVRTQARAATILPNFVGLDFEVHNGRDYLPVSISEDMVGHKLGEFAPYVRQRQQRPWLVTSTAVY